jgi:hypothetical protein
MDTITITFTTTELDIVCNALAQRPYMEVAALMGKIVESANPAVKDRFAPGLTLDDLGAAQPTR